MIKFIVIVLYFCFVVGVLVDPRLNTKRDEDDEE